MSFTRINRFMLGALSLVAAVSLTACSGLDPWKGARPATQNADSAADHASSKASKASGKPAKEAKPGPIAVILDASGSMTAEDAPGQRFAAAQKAVHGLVDHMEDDQQVALLTYGTGTGNQPSEQAAGCKDVTTPVPMGKLDRNAFLAQVDKTKPSGFTPIAEALKQASKQLPTSGDRTVILLSDGLDTCATGATVDGGGNQQEVCDVAKDLNKDGKLRIHTVGLRVDGQASKQLECLSSATHGKNWDALNDQQLGQRLKAALNPQLAEKRLSPDGYRGLIPGMSADDARAKVHFDGDVASRGVTKIRFGQVVLVFKDAILIEISSEKLSTLDGLKVGDDIARAERLYASPKLPTPLVKLDGYSGKAAKYTANAMTGLAYYFFYSDAQGNIVQPGAHGKITRILLKQGTTSGFAYSVSKPDPSIFPGCEDPALKCQVDDAIQVWHPESGPLTLAMVSGYDIEGLRENPEYYENEYDPRFFVLIFIIDRDGKVKNLDGSQITEDDMVNMGTGRGTGFTSPAVDNTGRVFYDSDGYKNTKACALSVDGKYFSQGCDAELTGGITPKNEEGWSGPNDGSWRWGGMDSRGTYILEHDLGSFQADSDGGYSRAG